MTLRGLLSSAKRYWMLALLCVVVCAAAGLGYGLMQRGSYKATATVASNVDSASLKGQADASAQKQKNAKVSIAVDTASKTLKITSESKSDRDAVVAANEVAKDTEVVARNMSAAASATGTATVSTSRARQASYARRNPLVFAAVGCAGGVFIALCVLVLVTDRKAPVNSACELEELTKIPVLGTLPCKDEGAQFAANVTFSVGDDPESVCLVPVNSVDVTEARDMLANAMAKSDGTSPRVVACKSIAQSADATYEAHKASATLLVIAEWNDSLKDVERTLHELKIAKANIAGILFVES